jgi:WhiB family redox-sensing transcriptional regulator
MRDRPDFPDAACRGMSVELFVTDDTRGRTSDEAKRVCWRCPEKEGCLDYALSEPSLVGVWGGTTVKERRLIRAERRTKDGDGPYPENVEGGG